MTDVAVRSSFRLGWIAVLALGGCTPPPPGDDATFTFMLPEGTTTGPATTGGGDPTSGDSTSAAASSGGMSATGDTTSGASSSGGAAECGNGVVEGDEECDDGPDNGATKACTNECLVAVCGDGMIHVAEEGCDDAGESVACDADCTPSACGDGTVNVTAGEDCEVSGIAFDCIACVAMCQVGTGDCNDDLVVDGCETDLTDPATCGDCMTTCALDEVCQNGTCLPPSTGTFLLTERNSPNIWQWDPTTAMTMLYHSAEANDIDCNLGQGSASGWIPNHFSDYFASFTPGMMGLDAQYGVPYAYPKHVTVFDGRIVVMSRNDATIHWYDTAGLEQGSLATGNGIGQGMATDGVELWASFWNGATSQFVRYDNAFVPQQMIANPAGLGVNVNVVDFAYHAGSGNFFGIVADFEQGTLTESNTVVEFSMGGAVLATYMLPFMADGIGQDECP